MVTLHKLINYTNVISITQTVGSPPWRLVPLRIGAAVVVVVVGTVVVGANVGSVPSLSHLGFQ